MKYSDIVSALKNVQNNNSREWYMQEKELFKDIHMVLEELYFTIGNRLHEKAGTDMNPRKSISRPYNDQRFGYKPYLRENLWVTFQSNECPAPAFFIEFSPCGIRIGMGYYSVTPAQMKSLRAKIDHDPRKFSNMIEKVLTDKEIHVIGEQYKKEFASNYEGLLKEIYNYRSIYFQKLILQKDWDNIEQISWDTFLELVPIYKLISGVGQACRKGETV